MVTLAEFEALLAELEKACERNSGLPSFDSLENRRKEVLTAISELRSLTRWEFICLHGYVEWGRSRPPMVCRKTLSSPSRQERRQHERHRR